MEILSLQLGNYIKGDKGDNGQSATIAIGSVTESESATAPEITNSGTSLSAIFDFIFPKYARLSDIPSLDGYEKTTDTIDWSRLVNVPSDLGGGGGSTVTFQSAQSGNNGSTWDIVLFNVDGTSTSYLLSETFATYVNSNFNTKDEITALLAEYAKTGDIPTDYITSASLSTTLEGYVTTQALLDNESVWSTALNDVKADIGNCYTKTEIDAKIGDITTILASI